MHDDPTRLMGRPEDPDHRPHGNMRLLVAGLIAVIVGLLIAVVVIAGDDGGSDTVPTVPSEATTLTTEPDTTEPATTKRPSGTGRPAMSASPMDRKPTASYEADPAQVRRVLLLYSGGLDTSVMLKWIQDSYGAEVVCLTVNLGQPGEDYGVIEEKAGRLGALECHVVDARERFATEYVIPAIKANALYGGGYPLFTALGRPLIAQLAVEHARESGCDTIAHGCTGKGNDQVRIEATVATLAPELRTIAPVRSWRMGREEEIA